MDRFNLIFYSIYWIFPAYVANALPVVFGGGTPIDLGKKLYDGRPIFGKGKTIRGFLIGILGGTFTGFLLGSLILGFLLSVGALLGDLGGSFLKRRIGIERGNPAWGLDQLGFVIGAIAFASLIEVQRIEVIVIVLILTPLIHFLTNYAAYKLGLKKVPW